MRSLYGDVHLSSTKIDDGGFPPSFQQSISGFMKNDSHLTKIRLDQNKELYPIYFCLKTPSKFKKCLCSSMREWYIAIPYNMFMG